MRHNDRTGMPYMTDRNKLYWSIYVQWLAQRDLLSYYLDDVIRKADRESGARTRIMIRRGDVENEEELYERNFSKALVLFIGTRTSSNRVSKRFMGYGYMPNLPEDHPFHARSWMSISAAFVDTCIRGKRTSKIKLPVIVKARRGGEQ